MIRSSSTRFFSRTASMMTVSFPGTVLPGTAWRRIISSRKKSLRANLSAQMHLATTPQPARCAKGYPQPSSLGSITATAVGITEPQEIGDEHIDAKSSRVRDFISVRYSAVHGDRERHIL